MGGRSPSQSRDEIAAEARAELMIAAEERLVWLRLGVVLLCGPIYVFFVDKAGTVAWLAYALLGGALAYSVLLIVTRPWRRFPDILSYVVTATLDTAVILVWLWATGGFDSPFYVMLYPSVLAVTFRYPPRQAFLAACVYAAGYALLSAMEGQMVVDSPELLVRVGFLFLSGILGALISTEVLRQITARAATHHEQLTEVEEARAAAEEARHVAEELATKLQEAVRVRDEFMSVASHELRTPVSALILRLAVLQKAATMGPEHVDEALAGLDRAMVQTGRLAQLVNSLLDVSRLTSGQLSLGTEACDLKEIVDEVAERIGEELERAGCTLRVLAEGETAGVWDRLRLDQVVTNLLSNALKYGAGKPIEVSLRGSGGHVVLHVRDHGIGMTEADSRRVFQRFERAVSSRNYGGLGLGLYICDQIVTAHAGTITVQSAPGAGSTFRVELPRGS